MLSSRARRPADKRFKPDSAHALLPPPRSHGPYGRNNRGCGESRERPALGRSGPPQLGRAAPPPRGVRGCRNVRREHVDRIPHAPTINRENFRFSPSVGLRPDATPAPAASCGSRGPRRGGAGCSVATGRVSVFRGGAGGSPSGATAARRPHVLTSFGRWDIGTRDQVLLLQELQPKALQASTESVAS